MKYTKPTLLIAGQAIHAVQGNLKIQSFRDNKTGHLDATPAAYEADE